MTPQYDGEEPLTREQIASRYILRGAAAKAHRCGDSIVLIAGPAGTGKSLANLLYVHQKLELFPNARAIMLRRTRSAATESIMVTYERFILGPDHPVLKGANIARSNRHSYKYPNGSEFVVGGLSAGAERAGVMSTEYDLAVLGEALEYDEKDVEDLDSRMRNGVVRRVPREVLQQIKAGILPMEAMWSQPEPLQQIRLDCNPGSPNHWLKRWEKTGRLKMFNSVHQDNPKYWDAEKNDWTPDGKAYVIGRLSKYTGLKRDRLYLGKWVQAEGIVYDNFNAAVHVIDEMPVGWKSWRKIRAIDFGYNNPFVCLWIAIDNDGRMYVYRELYMSSRTVRAHAEQINRLSEGEEYEVTLADHDAEDRATLRECGIHTKAAKKPIEIGIQAVKERLNNQGDGKPALFFWKNCLVERDIVLVERKDPTCMLEEFDSYIWDKESERKGFGEKPLDKDNHAMDALRYGVMHAHRSLGAIDSPEVLAEKLEIAKKAEQDERKRKQDEWMSPWNDALFGTDMGDFAFPGWGL